HKDVSRAGIDSAVIGLVTVNSGGSAVFAISSGHYGVPRDRDGDTEEIIRSSVGSFQIRLLRPGAARAHKDVSCTGTGSAVIRLIAVDSGSGAILVKSSNHHRVARDRYGATEEITRPR